jgi:hypothetical protein
MTHRATICGTFCAAWRRIKLWCVPDFVITVDSIDQDKSFGDRCPELVTDWDGFWQRCHVCGQDHFVSNM